MIKYRLARVSDRELIVNYYRETIPENFSELPESLLKIQMRIGESYVNRLSDPHFFIFLAFDKKKLVGILPVDIDDKTKMAAICSYNVKKRWRNRGIGGNLLNLAVNISIHKNQKKLIAVIRDYDQDVINYFLYKGFSFDKFIMNSGYNFIGLSLNLLDMLKLKKYYNLADILDKSFLDSGNRRMSSYKRLILILLAGGVIALSPGLIKAQSTNFSFDKKLPLPLTENKTKTEIVNKLNKVTTEDEYEWRKMYWYVVVNDSSVTEFDSLRWAFKKNEEPINDTTYEITQAGTTYVCGIYADTVVSEPDSHDVWIVKYEYVEQPYDSLQSKDPTATFEGDSVTTGTKWVYVTNIRYLYPSFVYWDTEQNTYFQQYDDGSVHNNAYGWVGYCSSPIKEKSYMVDNTVYYLSIPLNVTETINTPQTINIKVYPNPFNSSCVITVPAGVDVEICDLRGNVVYTVVVGATRRVAQQKGDAAHRPYIWTPDKTVPSGIYLVRAKTSDGEMITKRIVYLK